MKISAMMDNQLIAILEDTSNLDVRLIGSDGECRAHRIVLKMISQFLCNALVNEQYYNNCAVIHIPDFTKECIQHILSIIYHGTITITAEQFTAMNECAYALQINLNNVTAYSYEENVLDVSSSPSTKDDNCHNWIIVPAVPVKFEEGLVHHVEDIQEANINVSSQISSQLSSVTDDDKCSEKYIKNSLDRASSPLCDEPLTLVENFEVNNVVVKSVEMSYDVNSSKQDTKVKKGIFSCTKCEKTYKLKSSLREHIKKSHMNKQKVFDNRTENPQKCTQCEFFTHYPHSLQAHINKHNGNYVRRSNASKAYQCSVCDTRFLHLRSKLRHEKKVHDLNVMKDGTMANLDEVHNVAEETTTNINIALCDYCDEILFSATELKLHKRIHLLGKVDCNVCGKTLSGKYIKSHMDGHQTVKRHKCKFCGEGFPTSHQRYSHIVSNHRLKRVSGTTVVKKEKFHLCMYCGTQLADRRALNNHIYALHSDIRRFKCKICGKSCRWASTLSSHMAVHSTETFKCQACPKVFKSHRFRQTHMRKVHGLRCYLPKKPLKASQGPFTCEICKKEYVSWKKFYLHKTVGHITSKKCPVCKVQVLLGTYQKHIRDHRLDAMKYPCRYCSGIFPTKISVIRHMRRLHTSEALSVIQSTSSIKNKKLEFSRENAFPSFCYCGEVLVSKGLKRLHFHEVHNILMWKRS